MKWIALFVVLAFPAAAQDLPALYRVTSVAADDVLNVRAEPNGNATKLSELAHNATGVEVVEILADQSWAKVNLAETAGWVSMRYLTHEGAPAWYEMSTPLNCYGTEPFWDLKIPGDSGAMVLDRMDDGAAMGLGRTVISPAFDWPRTVGFSVQGPAREGFGIIRADDLCSDGMSDRQMGLTFRMFLSAPGGMESYIGCCSLR